MIGNTRQISTYAPGVFGEEQKIVKGDKENDYKVKKKGEPKAKKNLSPRCFNVVGNDAGHKKQNQAVGGKREEKNKHRVERADAQPGKNGKRVQGYCGDSRK